LAKNIAEDVKSIFIMKVCFVRVVACNWELLLLIQKTKQR